MSEGWSGSMTMMVTMRELGRGDLTESDRRESAGGPGMDAVFTDVAPSLYRSLYAYTGRRKTIAEEATAEAFARAVAYQGGIRNPRAWLYRTAFRIATQELREERLRVEGVPDVAVDPPDLLGLADALMKLAPKQRAVIALRYIADLSTGETAAALGISPATVRVHLFRGRSRLDELLREEEV
jgi:DNA-directed RNA polymerase specialized sigma24 family protein